MYFLALVASWRLKILYYRQDAKSAKKDEENARYLFVAPCIEVPPVSSPAETWRGGKRSAAADAGGTPHP
jgi:hypothetical protein